MFTWQSKLWVQVPLPEKKMNNLFAFESGWKSSLDLNRFPYRPKFSRKCFTGHQWPGKIISSTNRNHFQRSSNYCIAKLFSSLTPFQSRMHYYSILNPPNTVRMRHSLLIFIKHAFLERVNSFVFLHEGVAFQLFLQSPMRSNPTLFQDCYRLQQIVLSF